MKTKSQIVLMTMIDRALYHLDMLLWVRMQPWDDRFIPVIKDAQTFRDELMMKKGKKK